MKKDFVKRFEEMLADEGDMFFTSGDVSIDYNNIRNTIYTQGYWAGNRLRYYFDADFNLIRTEERRFG